ncbi:MULTISPECIES: outer membrane beta-barrel protein [Acidithiobacillaceae]|uniref:Outer membrane beta-barrel protein n=1 Tax=Igneacidithiobacillus copahuensis TaxID=2724909 RepID=A0AAE2YQY3_9PROT|nr:MULTISPECIES: outer membrane beta-barrel protein [Acidithiobacillaceae]MBU2763353.1 outer membrane beta-barrel protein [Acidithiobacillus caldus]MBU2771192.1 outer membrane beta-barrel protein [Acidithiobacillus caldus]MBU2788381.1 outer membrane beta-barrel protein [Igneacidithiobacillus copahuensis]MBU2796381.1 outer membrane beta-barrel protein [Acidithiobacillus sp. VAN18-2]
MRQIVLALALALGAVSVANAATVGAGFDNVGISAGPGLNMTLPGGYLKARQDFGPWVASARFEGAGGENRSDFFGGHAGIGYRFALAGLGYITPSLRMGYDTLNVPGGNLDAAFAGVHVRYAYAITPVVGLYADGGFGRDFATHVTGLSTIGGLTYEAGGGMDFHVGPGVLDAGYQYQHLPLSSANDLHLNTGQFTIGYGIHF